MKRSIVPYINDGKKLFRAIRDDFCKSILFHPLLRISQTYIQIGPQKNVKTAQQGGCEKVPKKPQGEKK